MEFYDEETWNKFMKKDGLIVERTPIYWNNEVVDEKVETTLNYRASNFKNRKAMYNKMLKDAKKLISMLENSLKNIEERSKNK